MARSRVPLLLACAATLLAGCPTDGGSGKPGGASDGLDTGEVDTSAWVPPDPGCTLADPLAIDPASPPRFFDLYGPDIIDVNALFGLVEEPAEATGCPTLTTDESAGGET
jgi:hypothetical protein